MIANLPLPPHYQPESVEHIFRVPYEQRAAEAERWAAEYNLRPAVGDKFRVALIAVGVVAIAAVARRWFAPGDV